MRVWEINDVEEESKNYTNIHNKDNRSLLIQDDDGNTVILHGEQIGKLYKAIKPSI